MPCSPNRLLLPSLKLGGLALPLIRLMKKMLVMLTILYLDQAVDEVAEERVKSLPALLRHCGAQAPEDGEEELNLDGSSIEIFSEFLAPAC